MAGKHGIKETGEMLVGCAVLGKVVLDLVKDGVQLNDAVALGTKLVADPVFRKALQDAADKADLIDDELGEIDFADAIDLAKIIPQLLEIFKKA